MTEPNEPDKEIEKTESTEDDDQIIDLVDVVETEDDDQIIDLVDAVEMEDNDQIINLEDDAVEIYQKDDSESIVGGVSEPVENETIIDLVESIGDTPEEIEEIGEPILETVEDSQDIDNTPEFEDNLIVEAVDFDDKFDTVSIVPEALKDDFADSLGVELDSNEDISKNTLEADNVSDEQVEAALERVIKKLFYEKIDRLLVETIEKTVAKEIERLKRALLEDQAYGEK